MHQKTVEKFILFEIIEDKNGERKEKKFKWGSAEDR